MKRSITILLIFILIISALSGCGGTKTVKDTLDKVGENIPSLDDIASSVNDKGNSSANNNEVMPGTELSTFMSTYMDAKSKVWDLMNEKIDEEENLSFLFGLMAFAFVDLSIIEVSFFDMLSITEGDFVKGTLMFSGIEAWKKTKGNTIEFGYDYVKDEDDFESKKGDREVANGRFDAKAGSLYYERYTERNSKKINHLVVEITQNSDTSFASQTYTVNSEDGIDGKDVSGYFVWFDDKDIILEASEGQRASKDLVVNSIFGKKNIKIEDMTKGLTTNLRIAYVDGEASYSEDN